VDPAAFTVRELVWMQRARSRETWMQCGVIASVVANTRMGASGRTYTPADFMPQVYSPKPAHMDIRDLEHKLGV